MAVAEVLELECIRTAVIHTIKIRYAPLTSTVTSYIGNSEPFHCTLDPVYLEQYEMVRSTPSSRCGVNKSTLSNMS